LFKSICPPVLGHPRFLSILLTGLVKRPISSVFPNVLLSEFSLRRGCCSAKGNYFPSELVVQSGNAARQSVLCFLFVTPEAAGVKNFTLNTTTFFFFERYDLLC